MTIPAASSNHDLAALRSEGDINLSPRRQEFARKHQLDTCLSLPRS